MSSPHQDFIFCQKHLQQAYFYVIFNSHPFKEMFIVSGIVTTLLPPVNTASSKEYLRKIQIIFMLLESAFWLSIFSEIFIQIG